MKKNWFNSKILTAILVVICIILTFAMYMQRRTRNYYKEAAKLPFYNVQAAEVMDGTFHGKAYTRFIHVQLDVTVQNHKITDIKITENEGLGGKKIEPLLNEIITQNDSVVPALKGDELASIVFIACVDDALFKGLTPERQKELKPEE